MNTKEYLMFHELKCKASRLLSEKKNHDYASPETRKYDPYAVWANFTLCETLGICSTETGMLVRLSDKLCRLSNLLKEGHERAVEDESIEDTENDIINYICLLSGYRNAKKELSPVTEEMK